MSVRSSGVRQSTASFNITGSDETPPAKGPTVSSAASSQAAVSQLKTSNSYSFLACPPYSYAVITRLCSGPRSSVESDYVNSLGTASKCMDLGLPSVAVECDSGMGASRPPSASVESDHVTFLACCLKMSPPSNLNGIRRLGTSRPPSGSVV
ncbi:hypothetical protein FB45DRAFT_441317 [Roridomyces roridus]|uniref:Uncharacterized protein n=1 Tax=Roridomyces roridus TaxID=1738132 RepID=A0AAD7FA02_9AGAR|nr:hypothetical protein FB45DRAFT_441317 [Roridomyces roridus]